ncbi:MAG: fibronectin type III domain-containing protein [Prevotella sp.]|nr:fibronectin type III domain-containing protein [Prevotella sp.]
MKRMVGILATILSVIPLMAQSWGDISYDGAPWTDNASRPYKITKGLYNHHLTVWASHGRYYDQSAGQWCWQRPALFGTTEDLFTQTIVVPYLIPMLERAGAVVFTPRERDWQRHEVIVDNDDHHNLFGYRETGFRHPWLDTGISGFALHSGNYKDGENPFEAGTARMAETTTSKSKFSTVSYQPSIPEAGRYAVYVSYQTVEGSIDDAHYTVWHKGEATEFRVNQQMGGSTWVYLGTFEFDQGCNEWNCVMLTNQSRHRGGTVTADAVRFGGGMGNIERGGTVSALPRCLEGARYYCQWAGMPYAIYSTKNGQNDYGDDINVRSLTGNLLAGGSCFVPNREGRHVPIELSLAVHSDAGFQRDGQSLYGALSIHTTEKDGSNVFNCQLPRSMSRSLASSLLTNAATDLRARFGISWPQREVRDRNYSETRLPEVPSAIFETMSHQSFPDMRYGQDPNFRFTLARSIYKTILRYVSNAHDDDCTVAPLAPTHLKVEFSNIRKGEVCLTWEPTADPQEPTAEPTGYVVYTATGSGGFNNGELVRDNAYTLRLEPGVLYSFQVSAVNRGGESFTSEVISALFNNRKSKTVLVANGFHRLSSPAIIDNDSLQGFQLQRDMGVSYGRTAGWLGQQTVFNKAKMGLEDATGLGYGTDELAGHFIAGNDFNYIRTHAEAIRQAGYYNIVSCSADALMTIDSDDYSAVDLILGLECNDGHSLLPYKTFTPAMQTWLAGYVRRGGCLLVSGANVGSDMTALQEEQVFLSSVLKCRFAGKSNTTDETIQGLGTTLSFYRQLNEQHYAATTPDILEPSDNTAIIPMVYADGQAAAVAYNGNDYRSFTMGFPFECIKSATVQADIMRGILTYLIK